MPLSPSQEDYIRDIWFLEQKQRKPTAKVIADHRKVKPPTVLAMFKQLLRLELITYHKSTGASLSQAGDRVARKLVRKHRLLETFLEKVLNFDGQLLHQEADRLEHVVSDKLVHRIDSYLGFPKKDPHGSPIPVHDEYPYPLGMNRIETGKSFRVMDMDLAPEMQRFYCNKDFTKGTIWTLLEKAPDGSVYTLTNGQVILPFTDQGASRVTVMPHY